MPNIIVKITAYAQYEKNNREIHKGHNDFLGHEHGWSRKLKLLTAQEKNLYKRIKGYEKFDMKAKAEELIPRYEEAKDELLNLAYRVSDALCKREISFLEYNTLSSALDLLSQITADGRPVDIVNQNAFNGLERRRILFAAKAYENEIAFVNKTLDIIGGEETFTKESTEEQIEFFKNMDGAEELIKKHYKNQEDFVNKLKPEMIKNLEERLEQLKRGKKYITTAIYDKSMIMEYRLFAKKNNMPDIEETGAGELFEDIDILKRKYVLNTEIVKNTGNNKIVYDLLKKEKKTQADLDEIARLLSDRENRLAPDIFVEASVRGYENLFSLKGKPGPLSYEITNAHTQEYSAARGHVKSRNTLYKLDKVKEKYNLREDYETLIVKSVRMYNDFNLHTFKNASEGLKKFYGTLYAIAYYKGINLQGAHPEEIKQTFCDLVNRTNDYETNSPVRFKALTSKYKGAGYDVEAGR